MPKARLNSHQKAYLKKQLPPAPTTLKQKATKLLQNAKHGANTAYNTSQKIANSKTLATIGRAAEGVSVGINKGANIFNESVGLTDFDLPSGNDDLLNFSPRRRHDERETILHRSHRKHRREREEIGDLI